MSTVAVIDLSAPRYQDRVGAGTRVRWVHARACPPGVQVCWLWHVVSFRAWAGPIKPLPTLPLRT